MQARGIASPDNADVFAMSYSVKMAKKVPPKQGSTSQGSGTFMGN